MKLRRDANNGLDIASIGRRECMEVFSGGAEASGQVIEDIALLNLGLQRSIALRWQSYHSACEVVAQSDALSTTPAGLAGRIIGRSCLLRVAVPAAQLHLYWHANCDFDPANDPEIARASLPPRITTTTRLATWLFSRGRGLRRSYR